MGKGNIPPPTESTPLNRSPKISHRWICRRPLQLCLIRCISVLWGLLGTWVKYNWIIFIYAIFGGTHLQVRPVDGFSHMMAQTTRTRARMCLFGICSHSSQFRGSKPPKHGRHLEKNRKSHISAAVRAISTKFGTMMQCSSARLTVPTVKNL